MDFCLQLNNKMTWKKLVIYVFFPWPIGYEIQKHSERDRDTPHLSYLQVYYPNVHSGKGWARTEARGNNSI